MNGSSKCEIARAGADYALKKYGRNFSLRLSNRIRIMLEAAIRHALEVYREVRLQREHRPQPYAK